MTLLIIATTVAEGREFISGTHAGIVRQMRDTQWGAPIVKKDYKREVAERVEAMSGVTAPAKLTAKSFLKYLVEAGTIRLYNSDEDEAFLTQ